MDACKQGYDDSKQQQHRDNDRQAHLNVSECTAALATLYTPRRSPLVTWKAEQSARKQSVTFVSASGILPPPLSGMTYVCVFVSSSSWLVWVECYNAFKASNMHIEFDDVVSCNQLTYIRLSRGSVRNHTTYSSE